MQSQIPIFPTAYFGNINYWAYLICFSNIDVEIYEYFEKQTLRNSTDILTANGSLKLSIPLITRTNKMLTKDVCIDYKTNWQEIHKRAIISSYNNAPYFEFYWPYINDVFNKKRELLIDQNKLLIETIIQILKIDFITFNYTSDYVQVDEQFNFRDRKKFNSIQLQQKTYQQVFTNKQAFTPNLSILDLIFNKGPESYWILEKN